MAAIKRRLLNVDLSKSNSYGINGDNQLQEVEEKKRGGNQEVEEKKSHAIMSVIQQCQRDEFKNNLRATQPFFNNQNTVLMAARSCRGDIMLMHETRIFYFSHYMLGFDSENDFDTNYAKAVDHITTLILGMLTTRKYRLLTSFYLVWRILDYAMLVALILAICTSGGGKFDFLNMITDNKWMFSVVALEIFYDVLEFIVKIWIVNRLSIYIGFILYGLYAAVLFYNSQHLDEYDITAKEQQLFFVLFGIRFVSFLFEELIDFCIDLELEYDFSEKTIHKLDLPICIKAEYEERIALLHVSNHNEMELAKGWNFRGSICVWALTNTFKCDIERKEKINPSCYRFIFHFMFTITYCIIGLPFLIIVAIILLVLALVKWCCQKRTDTILDECFHRYSY